MARLAAVTDDRVQRLGRDDRPLGLLVDVRQQRAELVGGEEQAVALVVIAVDRHPDAVQEAGPRDHHLGVALAHPVVGDDARDTPRRNSSRARRRRDVEHDLDVDPAVIRHPEPPGGVDRRDVPPRFELLVGVDAPRAAARAGGCLASGARTRTSASASRGGIGGSSLIDATLPAARPRECHPGRPPAGRRTAPRPPRGSAAPPGSSRDPLEVEPEPRATSSRARRPAASAPARTRSASSTGPPAGAATSRCRRRRRPPPGAGLEPRSSAAAICTRAPRHSAARWADQSAGAVGERRPSRAATMPTTSPVRSRPHDQLR